MADTLVTPSRWLAPLPDAQSVGARGILLCFPYGGGGASSFQGLSSLQRVGIAAWDVKLPGREERIQEASITSVKDLIDHVVEGLLQLTLPCRQMPHAVSLARPWTSSRLTWHSMNNSPIALSVPCPCPS